jgi:hypothetical protein
VVLGNGLLVVTFALLKGCHGRGEKEWGGVAQLGATWREEVGEGPDQQLWRQEASTGLRAPCAGGVAIQNRGWGAVDR